MTATYTLKIERAKKHVREADEILQKQRPFRYVLETDYAKGQRSIGAVRNESVINELSLVAGDAIHNLRAALDHRVYEIVSPHVLGEWDRKSVQFPFARSGSNEHIESAFKNRKIHSAPKDVWAALEKLKPYPGGDDDLVLLHELDIIDKHKLFIPSADYKQLDSRAMRLLVPDFPPNLFNVTLSGNRRDVSWPGPRRGRNERRVRGSIEEHDLPVPVEIIISEPGKLTYRSLMPTLYDLTKMVERIIGDLAGL